MGRDPALDEPTETPPHERAAGPAGAALPDRATQEAAAKASRRRMLIGIGGTILVLVVVSWFIFSFVIDPEVVVDPFPSLELWQLGVLALMAAATYVFQGLTLKSTSGPGLKDATLGLKDATLGMLASLAVKDSTPGAHGHGLRPDRCRSRKSCAAGATGSTPRAPRVSRSPWTSR